MSVTIILTIIIVHYIADFVFQTDEMAINKSKSNKHLFQHVGIYSSIWLLGGILYILPVMNISSELEWENLILKFCIVFPVVTFICHFIIDYLTSRWSSYLYQKGERHNFFLVIGFDQVLHYTQLFLTFKLLTQ